MTTPLDFPFVPTDVDSTGKPSPWRPRKGTLSSHIGKPCPVLDHLAAQG